MTPATKDRITCEADFIRVICDRVALRFKNPPRLRVIRDEEERAAKRLYDAGYKAARLLSIMEWGHSESDFEGWRKVLTSVSGLAKHLLEPKNATDCLESRYDVWLMSNPPMCPHGRLLELKNVCPGCQADPDCKLCFQGVTSRWVSDDKELQFVCDCASKKIGLPPLEEQVRLAREKRESKKPKTAEKLDDDEVL